MSNSSANRLPALLWSLLFISAGFVSLSILSQTTAVNAISCPTTQGAGVSSGWGPRDGRMHAGLDISVNFEALYAAESGEVETYWNDGGYQYIKDLRADNGRLYRYAHIDQGGVSGRVNAGQQIGTSGNGSGEMDYAHLHWEIRTRPNAQDGSNFGFDGTIDPLPDYNSCGGSGGPETNPPSPTTPPPTTAPNCHQQELVYSPSTYNPCVGHLQNDLIARGENLVADGYFGPATEAAIKRLQLSQPNPIPDTGVVNGATWCKIHTDLPGCTFGSTPPPAPISQPPAPSPQPTPQPVSTSGGTGRIQGAGSGRCLDVEVINGDGDKIVIWDCSGSSYQSWTYDASSKTLKVSGNKCLDIAGYATDNGSSVQLWGCHGQSNQQWERYGNNQIRSLSSGRCLDVQGYGTSNGSRVSIWDCHGQSNQQWTWPAPTSSPAPAPQPAPIAQPPAPAPSPTPVFSPAPAPVRTRCYTFGTTRYCF